MLSANYGLPESWRNVTALSSRPVKAIALSASGDYVLVAINTRATLLLSRDRGANFSLSGWALNYLDVALSASGQYQLALGSPSGSGAVVVCSQDFGQSWRVQHSITTSSSDASRVAMSSSGMFQAATFGNELHVSDDFGLTWRQPDIPNQRWVNLAMVSTTNLTATFPSFG
jgi:photosystem II stability/assembly factor-like uncharacterized protein